MRVCVRVIGVRGSLGAQSRFTFSFAEYRDRRFDSFGILRVLNDDTVAAGEGFPMHPHADFEIFSYILSGCAPRACAPCLPCVHVLRTLRACVACLVCACVYMCVACVRCVRVACALRACVRARSCIVRWVYYCVLLRNVV